MESWPYVKRVECLLPARWLFQVGIQYRLLYRDRKIIIFGFIETSGAGCLVVNEHDSARLAVIQVESALIDIKLGYLFELFLRDTGERTVISFFQDGNIGGAVPRHIDCAQLRNVHSTWRLRQ